MEIFISQFDLTFNVFFISVKAVTNFFFFLNTSLFIYKSFWKQIWIFASIFQTKFINETTAVVNFRVEKL